jgi:hypothetical protein
MKDQNKDDHKNVIIGLVIVAGDIVLGFIALGMLIWFYKQLFM